MPRVATLFSLAFAALPALALPPAPEDPTRETIVFATMTPPGKELVVSIAVMKADGSGRATLSSGATLEMDPALSPDGKRIAFVVIDKESKKADVWVMNADGKGRTKLTDQRAKTFALDPSWSPDGKRVAFWTIGDPNGPPADGEVKIMDADGGNIKSLGKGAQPAWSPDGKRVLYVAWSGRDRQPHMALMDADGKNAQQVVKRPSLLGSWSPDGKKIAYTGNPDTRSSQAQIYVSNPDGSDEVQLTRPQVPDTDAAPQWSRDGKRIYFSRLPVLGRGPGLPDEGHIWAVDVDGKGKKELTKEAGVDLLGSATSAFVIEEIARSESRPKNP